MTTGASAIAAKPRCTHTGVDYHGCLVISVPESRELYWKVEGVMAALTGLR